MGYGWALRLVLWTPMTLSLPAALEAVLFAAGEPLTEKRLGDLLGVPVDMIKAAAEDLSTALSERGLALIAHAGEYELRTSADAAELVKKLRESELSRDLGKASLEALAVILYQDGATRGDIDWVRGVNSSAAIRSLLLRGLIERVDDPTDRRRARYRATMDALGHLGLTSAAALPRYEEFAGALTAQRTAQEVASEVPNEAE
jgi:segregation and condensation protein B